MAIVLSYCSLGMGSGMVTTPYSGRLALPNAALIRISFLSLPDNFHSCPQALPAFTPAKEAVGRVGAALTAG